jgi:hypothetical protein
MIYSTSFQSLPVAIKQAVYRRLHEILTDPGPSEDFPHLTAPDKKAIHEILGATLPDYAEAWKVK